MGRQDLLAHAQSGLARVLEEEGRYTEALPLAQSAWKSENVCACAIKTWIFRANWLSGCGARQGWNNS
ncbi:MAG: hypothetical protein V7L22_28635 [Nostoc sp.]|uniref:hypothetical protein n=1 Tax=Nostoc sp. TaxID=1180 RepID=UPI002FFC5913